MSKVETVTEAWKGQTAFILGGGFSLNFFDLSKFKGLNVIGCNDAYTLGSDICPICCFGDRSWFYKHKDNLKTFAEKGMVYTHLSYPTIDWAHSLKKYETGVHRDGLGWNGNTGSLAINLALILGASRIFLLGYDMCRIQDRSNWHKNNIRPEATQPFVYANLFIPRYTDTIAPQVKSKFPDVSVYNVTEFSTLKETIFPWADPIKFFDMLELDYQLDASKLQEYYDSRLVVALADSENVTQLVGEICPERQVTL